MGKNISGVARYTDVSKVRKPKPNKRDTKVAQLTLQELDEHAAWTKRHSDADPFYEGGDLNQSHGLL